MLDGAHTLGQESNDATYTLYKLAYDEDGNPIDDPEIYRIAKDYITMNKLDEQFYADEGVKGRVLAMLKETVAKTFDHDPDVSKILATKEDKQLERMMQQFREYYITHGYRRDKLHDREKLDNIFDENIGGIIGETITASSKYHDLNDIEDRLKEIITAKSDAMEEGGKTAAKMLKEAIGVILTPTETSIVKKGAQEEKWKKPRDETLEWVKKQMGVDWGLLKKDPKKDEEMERRAKDITNRIYTDATYDIMKKYDRLARFRSAIGHNPQAYQYLPEQLQETLNDYITKQNEIDMEKKELHYIKPAEKPKWERAVRQYNINPQLARNGWSTSNKHHNKFQ